jgi:superfamily I DNA/RNA helicase
MAALYAVLSREELGGLGATEFSSGPLRMAASPDRRILCIWNKEYLSGTGSEYWGIFKLSDDFGLLSFPNISQQVFERILYVFNQRLQDLIIDSDFIHRPWSNGSHTCLAGRGTEARQYSIAYFEGGPGYGSLSAKAVIAVGPKHDFDELQRGIESELRNFVPLVEIANGVVDHGRRRPLLEAPAFQDLREALSSGQAEKSHLGEVNVPTAYRPSQKVVSNYETMHWDYARWLQSGTLNEVQKRVLNNDPLSRHPVRITGPAGSGKTLLMQLLALRYLHDATDVDNNTSILYVVHNSAMAQMVIDRLRTLGADEFLTGNQRSITVTTLAEYARGVINLSDDNIIDKDAQATKIFQLDVVQTTLREVLSDNCDTAEETPLIIEVRKNNGIFEIFSQLVMAEISTVIKGRGLVDDRKRYTDADVPFSRFHSILSYKERGIVFDVFKRYHHLVFEEYEMLDADDLALTLAGRLRTPLWSLKRKAKGFDFIFVDEAHLFNENERRIFPYLTKGTTGHVPIALALDQAQEPFGFSSAGLAKLGIADVENETLPSNHRSTREIVDLAFFMIQQTTDLFDADFPDFSSVTSALLSSEHSLASPPQIVTCHDEARSYGRFVVKLAQKLRANNIRQIGVLCHSDKYWAELINAFGESQLPLHVIKQRGEKLNPDQPLIILSRPAFIGGQEFDAVILVGLEQGVVPPRVADNPALAAAMEQQMLREIYLTVSRARYRVIATLNRGTMPNEILQEAISRKLIEHCVA